MNREISKPIGVVLVLSLLATILSLLPILMLAKLDAANSERDAKESYLAQVSSRARVSVQAAKDTAEEPFVVADSEGLAAAKIDSFVRSIAGGQNVSVLSTQSEIAKDQTDLGVRIELKAVLEGTNEALQASLFRLETSSPILLANSLDLQPSDEIGTVDGDAQATRLRAEVKLQGYWNIRPPAASN